MGTYSGVVGGMEDPGGRLARGEEGRRKPTG